VAGGASAVPSAGADEGAACAGGFGGGGSVPSKIITAATAAGATRPAVVPINTAMANLVGDMRHLRVL
jgi:hypothetical protein